MQRRFIMGAASRRQVVDVGASRVACGVFAKTANGGLRLEQFAVERHGAGASPEGVWIAETARALERVAKDGRWRGKAWLSVAGHVVLTKCVKTPAIATSKRARIVEFEAAQNIPYPLSEVVWDHGVVSDDGRELEVMLAAAKADTMQALCEAADRSGFAASRAIPSCVALVRGFRFNYPEVSDGVLLVNIGARSTHLLWVEPRRFLVRTLALGGNTVTRAIAEELGIDFDVADALKRGVLSASGERPADSPSERAVRRAGEAFALRLQLEVTRSMVNLGRDGAGTRPARIFLAGGGAAIDALPGMLAEKFALPVERYEPLRRVELSPALDAVGVKENAGLLAELVGLAVCGKDGGDREPSLLPAAWAETRAFRQRRPVLLAVAALAAVVGVPLIRHQHQVASEAAARVAEFETRLAPARAATVKHAGQLEAISAVQQEVEALRGVVAARASWSEFLADLQSRLAVVEDAWLEELSIAAPEERAASSTGDDATPPPLRLRVSGCLLNAAPPGTRAGANSHARAKQLLASVAGSPFIAAVENERFDGSRADILQFDFTLVTNPGKPL